MPDHPWANMSDQEILKSAGLFQEDRESGKSGYTLAAVLLFGRDELIPFPIFNVLNSHTRTCF